MPGDWIAGVLYLLSLLLVLFLFYPWQMFYRGNKATVYTYIYIEMHSLSGIRTIFPCLQWQKKLEHTSLCFAGELSKLRLISEIRITLSSSKSIPYRVLMPPGGEVENYCLTDPRSDSELGLVRMEFHTSICENFLWVLWFVSLPKTSQLGNWLL